MKGDPASLSIFLAVARHRSFRRAADELGCTPSALSHSMRTLEERLQIRLLNRTTRSVALTEAGQRLHGRIEPAFRDITDALDDLNTYRDQPIGALRINAAHLATQMVLLPLALRFMRQHPQVRLEIVSDNALVDMVSEGFDAGVRFGEIVAQDMIAVPIGPRLQRYAGAASAAYLEEHGRPQHPRDLLQHACIRGRFAGRAIPVWEFERDGEIVRVDPPSPLIVQNGGGTDLAVDAAIAGTGIVFTFADWLKPYFEGRMLEPVLEPWWQSFSGPFLYYPGRRLVPAPLRAFIDFIKAMPREP